MIVNLREVIKDKMVWFNKRGPKVEVKKDFQQLQNVIKELEEYKCNDISIVPVLKDGEEVSDVRDVFLNAWSNGYVINNSVIPNTDLDTMYQKAEGLEKFLMSKDPEKDVLELNELMFALKVKDDSNNSKTASVVNLKLDHENQNLEICELATHKDFANQGFARTMFNWANWLNKDFFQYLQWSEENTISMVPQEFNRDASCRSVGFLPLKNFITTHYNFHNDEKNNYDLVFADGRNTNVLQMKMLKAHKKERLQEAYLVERVSELQHEVGKQFGVYTKVHNDIEGDLPTGTMDSSSDFIDDNVSNSIKIINPYESSVSSIVDFAKRKFKKYIEIDVPAIKGSTRLQQELVNNAFFPSAYMPGFKVIDGERCDVVRFSYLTNRDSCRDYCATFKDKKNNLREIVLPENEKVANIVLGNLEKSLMIR